VALSSGGWVDQTSTLPTAPNRSERLDPGRSVTTRSPQRPAMVPNQPAAPVLRGASASEPAGAALRVVDGGEGHLLTVRAVAARLGVSTATVYKIVAQGDLPHVRLSNAIRVTPADLDAFLVRYRGQAGGRKESR
jgi:excisionase family DNA binding protein